MAKLAWFLCFLCSLWLSAGHPIPTFLMILCDSNGKAFDDQYNGANLTVGVNSTLYFYFQDLEHNMAVVNLSTMMPMHQRMIHILLVSEDNELTAHTHPDDFVDIYSLPNSTTVFHVKISFPRGGIYSIAANFMFNDVLNNTYRDGFAQTEFRVAGLPAMNRTGTVRNYNQTNRYGLWNFTDAPREIYNGWIDTTKNYDSQGYWGKLQLSIDGKLVSTDNINITQLDCAYFVVTMYNDDVTESAPAPILPLMAAPVHFTLVNYDGAVYHAHGMYLPDNMTFPNALTALGKISMAQMMAMDPMVDPMYNLSMTASMIGVNSSGQIDCFTDEGKVMWDMDQMALTMPDMKMDMNMFYGPDKYNVMASIFNWPNSFNWRIYAWMKIKDTDGNERLIVPHWDIWVKDTPFNYTSSSIAEESNASTLSISALLAGVAALWAVSM